MKIQEQIKSILQNAITLSPQKAAMFFKTGKGDYAENDQFIGVTIPNLRIIAKKFENLSTDNIQFLMKSPINEERLLALLILTEKYKKSSTQDKEVFVQFYLKNLNYVNNWNLVDCSCHLILGAHLHDKKKDLLLTFSKSDIMWERRIAIVSTLYFIRQNDLKWTFKIAKILIHDKHDLIHKATGWMLREAGKKDRQSLVEFLDAHATRMPRTMLRYAIEKFPESMRKSYLKK